MGVSQEATMSLQFDVGDSAIDPDHRALAELLEALERVCMNPATPDCRCDCCPERKVYACQGSLREICTKMQTLLLDHFQREQELMNSLPRNPAVKIHCERHRREHVSFSTRYNLAAAQLSTSQPAIAARELEVLVFDWIRSHALEFDAKLAELLHRPVEGAYR